MFMFRGNWSSSGTAEPAPASSRVPDLRRFHSTTLESSTITLDLQTHLREPLFRRIARLEKMGGRFKAWRRRTFALDVDRNELMYFKDDEALKEYTSPGANHLSAALRSGLIALDGAVVSPAGFLDSKRPCCVEVFVNKPVLRYFYVDMDIEPEMVQWLRDISECRDVTFVAETRTAPWLACVVGPWSCARLGMNGWMEKRGAVNKSYKRRFFRVKPNRKTGKPVLAYFVSFHDVKPKGTIPLFGTAVEEDEADVRIFYLSAPSRRFEIRAPSAKLREVWVTLLRQCAAWESYDKASLIDLKQLSTMEEEPVVDDEEEEEEEEEAAAENELVVVESRRRSLSARQLQRLSESGDDSSGEEDARKEARLRRRKRKQREAEALMLRSKYLNLLQEGAHLLKFGRKGKPHVRTVFARGVSESSGFTHVCWCAAGKLVEEPTRRVELDTSTQIVKGKSTPVFERKVANKAPDSACFSIVGARRTLDLQAQDEAQRDLWCAALEWALKQQQRG